MSMSWYPNGWEIYVDNPGYGEMTVRHDETDWHYNLVGEDVASFLTELTSLALGLPNASRRLLPPRMTEGMARELLPSLQRAVVLAAAATDRFERLFRDDDEPPQEPLCVRCNEGTGYSDVALPSKRCAEWGHVPFGMGAETKWDRAQSRYATQREMWDRAARRIGSPVGF
jgi:hypothetical protein